MKSDRQKTEAANFIDPKSYITPDGREILKGLDWKQRVGELRERSGGRCEFMVTTPGGVLRCSQEAADPHHKTLRSVLRNDALDALMAVCRPHHDLLTAQQRKKH